MMVVAAHDLLGAAAGLHAAHRARSCRRRACSGRSAAGLTMFAMYLLGALTALALGGAAQDAAARHHLGRSTWSCRRTACRPARLLARQVWGSAAAFLQRAGTVILGVSIVLWVLLNFPRTHATDPDAARPSRAGAGQRRARALAARLGHAIEPAIAPLGFDWKIGVGLVGEPRRARGVRRDARADLRGRRRRRLRRPARRDPSTTSTRRPGSGCSPCRRRCRCWCSSSSRCSARRPSSSWRARPAAGSGRRSRSPTCSRSPTSGASSPITPAARCSRDEDRAAARICRCPRRRADDRRHGRAARAPTPGRVAEFTSPAGKAAHGIARRRERRAARAAADRLRERREGLARRRASGAPSRTSPPADAEVKVSFFGRSPVTERWPQRAEGADGALLWPASGEALRRNLLREDTTRGQASVTIEVRDKGSDAGPAGVRARRARRALGRTRRGVRRLGRCAAPYSKRRERRW